MTKTSNIIRRKAVTAGVVARREGRELGERAFARVAGTALLRSAIVGSGRTVLHCLGDSHTRSYRAARRHLRGVVITTTVVRGATAYGLANRTSESGAAEKYMAQLSRAHPDDQVLLHIGEVDCGSLIWRIEERREVPHGDVLMTSLGRLIDFADGLQRPLIVAGVTPPTVDDYTVFEGTANPRYGMRASYEDRLAATRTWNAALQSWADSRGHVFMDVFHAVLGPDSRVRPEFRPNNIADHHLAEPAFARYVGEIALPRALRSN